MPNRRPASSQVARVLVLRLTSNTTSLLVWTSMHFTCHYFFSVKQTIACTDFLRYVLHSNLVALSPNNDTRPNPYVKKPGFMSLRVSPIGDMLLWFHRLVNLTCRFYEEFLVAYRRQVVFLGSQAAFTC